MRSPEVPSIPTFHLPIEHFPSDVCFLPLSYASPLLNLYFDGTYLHTGQHLLPRDMLFFTKQCHGGLNSMVLVQ